MAKGNDKTGDFSEPVYAIKSPCQQSIGGDNQRQQENNHQTDVDKDGGKAKNAAEDVTYLAGDKALDRLMNECKQVGDRPAVGIQCAVEERERATTLRACFRAGGNTLLAVWTLIHLFTTSPSY